jgi:hypothetical protein
MLPTLFRRFNQVPEISIKILEHGHGTIRLPGGRANKNNPATDHFLIVSVEIIGVQE